MTQVNLESKSPNRDIFSALAKEGTFKILEESDSKLISKRETPQKLGLTKRQYYSRLRELKNLNIIKKEGEGYVRTERGKKVCRLTKGISTLSEDNIEKIGDLEDLPLNQKELKDQQAKVITDYEELVEDILETFENSTDEIILASRYMDNRIINKGLNSVKENSYNLRVLVPKLKVSESIELLKAISSPSMIKPSMEMAEKNLRVLSELPYSFMVADQKKVFIEIINPFRPSSFYMSICLKNEKIGRRLEGIFSYLFDNGEAPQKKQKENNPNPF